MSIILQYMLYNLYKNSTLNILRHNRHNFDKNDILIKID